MKYKNMLILLNEASNSKFATRKCNIVNDQSSRSSEKEIFYNTKVLISNFCGYKDAYILVKGDITVVAVHATQVPVQNCASFTKCITKIDGKK